MFSSWSKEGFTILNDVLDCWVKHYHSFIMPEKCHQKFKHRGYSSIHAFSWAINLEKFGYTNCMFRNCLFMALDIDAIASHHYECPGGGNNDRLFMCTVCKRGTSEESTLNNHYILSHPDLAEMRGISSISYDKTMPKIISNVRKKSWELFLERKGYIKCLIQNCQFITDDLDVIQSHFESCSKGKSACIMGEMAYSCDSCFGKTNDKQFLQRHSEICNNSNRNNTGANIKKTLHFQPEVTREIIDLWSENIRKYKAAKCPKNGCRFIDNNIMTLKSHFTKCKQSPAILYLVCNLCGGWLINAKKLDEHLNSVHKSQGTIPKVCLVLKEDDAEDNFRLVTELSVYSANIKDENQTERPTVNNGRKCEKKPEEIITPLSRIAEKLMDSHETAVPVHISVEDQSWTVNVAPSVLGTVKLSGNILNDLNSIGAYMRQEADNLLKSARTKNTALNRPDYFRKSTQLKCTSPLQYITSANEREEFSCDFEMDHELFINQINTKTNKEVKTTNNGNTGSNNMEVDGHTDKDGDDEDNIDNKTVSCNSVNDEDRTREQRKYIGQKQLKTETQNQNKSGSSGDKLTKKVNNKNDTLLSDKNIETEKSQLSNTVNTKISKEIMIDETSLIKLNDKFQDIIIEKYTNCNSIDKNGKYLKKSNLKRKKMKLKKNNNDCMENCKSKEKCNKEKKKGFLGFSNCSNSYNRFNHLLSYCNILGIRAQVQTYPIHVKYDVTNKKNSLSGNSNSKDDKKDENERKYSEGTSRRNQNPSDNSSDSSFMRRKLDRKPKKLAKNTNSSGKDDDKNEEYQTFVGTLGETSTPQGKKRNERKDSFEENKSNKSAGGKEVSSTITTRGAGKLRRNNSKEQDITKDEVKKKTNTEESTKRELRNSRRNQAEDLVKEESESDDEDNDEEDDDDDDDDDDSSDSSDSDSSSSDSSDSSEDDKPVRKRLRLTVTDSTTNSKKKKDNTSSESINSSNQENSTTRNQSSDDDEDNDDNEEMNSSSNDNTKEDSSIIKPTEDTSNTEDAPVAKRKRGRPRKIPGTGPTHYSVLEVKEDREKTENVILGRTRRGTAVRSYIDDSDSNQATNDVSNAGADNTGNYDVGYLPPVKRKPGRPRKIFTESASTSMEAATGEQDSLSNLDSDAANNTTSSHPKKKRSSWHRARAVYSNADEDPDRIGTCVNCHLSMTVKDFKKKHMPIHNFLCWLEGDEPLDLNNENAMINWLTRQKKYFPKHVFRCEKCGETKKSVKGFLSHLQFCGKSLEERQKLMVACPICGRVMMPSSLEQHRPLCSRKVPVKDAAPEVEEGPLTPRKAAKQCLDTIADIAPKLLDDASPNKKRKSRNVDVTVNEEDLEESDEENVFDINGEINLDVHDAIKELFTMKTKRITKHLKTIWEMSVADGKPLQCPCPSCDFNTPVFSVMNEHYKTCSHDFQGYVCKDCKFSSATEKEMIKHIKKEHLEQVNSIKKSNKPSKRMENLTGSNYIPFLKKAEIAFNQSMKQAKFFRPAINWTQEQRNLYYTSEPIFPEYKYVPESWKLMKSDEIEQYLPEKKESIKFNSKQSTNWEQLKLFQSKFLNDDLCVIFTGGPVWGLSWAPGNNDVQYLAISTHLSMQSSFSMGSVFIGPGLIQIWSLQNVDNMSNLSNGKMKLEYGFCHDYGGCWALEWCPAGCQDESRIGLLAVATTSGIIPVFAVPTPAALSNSESSDQSQHYKPEPALLLKLSAFVNSQCTRISWSKVKPHRTLVAGFTNGIIGIWDLSLQSLLLRTENTLYPFKTFHAHHSNITGLCLSPTSETYLVSSASDKTVKFWDLNNTSTPQSIHRRGLVNDVSWMHHWLCAVAVYDESYLTGQTTVALHSVRDYIYQPCSFVSSVKSSAWCVSISDWLNAIATSYDNGQITVAFAKQHDQSAEKRDEKRKVVKVILETSLFDFERKAPVTLNRTNTKLTSGSTLSSSCLSSNSTTKSSNLISKPSTSSAVDPCESRTVDCCTYEEVSEKYGIRFDSDISFTRETNLEGNQPNPIDIYPLMSANKVAWNPNRKALLTMAVGYQSGFVVIPKLTFPLFDQKHIETFVKSFPNERQQQQQQQQETPVQNKEGKSVKFDETTFNKEKGSEDEDDDEEEEEDDDDKQMEEVVVEPLSESLLPTEVEDLSEDVGLSVDETVALSTEDVGLVETDLSTEVSLVATAVETDLSTDDVGLSVETELTAEAELPADTELFADTGLPPPEDIEEEQLNNDE